VCDISCLFRLLYPANLLPHISQMQSLPSMFYYMFI
jgi:hypothetical protein